MTTEVVCPRCGTVTEPRIEPLMCGSSDRSGPLTYWRCPSCRAIFSRLSRATRFESTEETERAIRSERASPDERATVEESTKQCERAVGEERTTS